MTCICGSTRSGGERITRAHFRKALEVAVGRPEFVNVVLEAEGGDAGVVDAGAAGAVSDEQRFERRPVRGGLCEERDGG